MLSICTEEPTMSSLPVRLYVTDTMADWETGHAIAHISKRSWQRTPGRYHVRTVAARREPVMTMGGVRIVPDDTFEEISAASSAMLILPGAETWDDEAEHAHAIGAAARFLAAGTPVAAICGATFGLAVSGLLDDREHTSNAAIYLASSGYDGAHLYREQPAINDRGLITASGCFPVDFAAEIFAQLELYEPEILKAWHGLYSTGDPAHFAVLAAA
jgi:transcriptional regulator GlxA family with amidase domain